MAWTLYNSTDTSAPVLTGTSGSLITVLDACLVNGYGTQPAAGWTKTNGTNARRYRPASSAKTAAVWEFLVSDAANTIGYVIPVKSASPYDGTTLVPSYPDGYAVTGGGTTNYSYFWKSDVADASARAWQVYADEKTCHMFSAYGGTNWASAAGASKMFSFGEFFSYSPNDAFQAYAMGDTSATSVYAQWGPRSSFTSAAAAPQVTVVRAQHGYGDGMIGATSSPAATQMRVVRMNSFRFTRPHGGVSDPYSTLTNGNIVSANGSIRFPNPPDGGLIMSPIFFVQVTETGSRRGIRGKVRGMFHIEHASYSSPAVLDTFTGTGDLSGKTFTIQKPYQYIAAASRGLIAVESSNTVDAS